MRTFFRFIRNIFLLALLAFGVWTYKNNPNFQIATNDSLATLSYRINQLLTSGIATAPKMALIQIQKQILTKLKMIILLRRAFGQSRKLMSMLILKIISSYVQLQLTR